MKHALVLNLAILAVIALVIVVTGNVLALLALVLLRDMPYGLLANEDEDGEGGPPGNPIGFVT